MVDYIILIILFVIIWCVSLLAMHWHYQKKEHKLMDTLQEMIDAAAHGEISHIDFNESKLSYLENSMKHHLLSQEVFLESLRKQKETVQSMITDISHQSTTPISNILLYTELLEEQEKQTDKPSHNLHDKQHGEPQYRHEYEPQDEPQDKSQVEQQDKQQVETQSKLRIERTEELSIIKEEVQKLDFLIQALVKAARLETGIITVTPKEEELTLLFEAVKSQYLPFAHNRGINLIIEPTSTRATFDLKWTVEAISNIIDNALKYTPSGGMVTMQAIPYQMFLRIDITDTGMGISEEEKNKIFLRFYRSLDACKISGVGIGLYLSREIIQMQKGYIKVSSQKGKGSRFSVFLPI